MATKLPPYLQAIYEELAPISSVTKDGSVSSAPKSSAFDVEPVSQVPAYSPLDTSVTLASVAPGVIVGTSPSAGFAPSVDPEQPPIAVAPSTGEQILSALKGIGSNILDTLKTTATSAVRGGLEGATATSAGAASGARVGAGAVSLNFTLLAVALLAAVVLLKKR